jgi:hypothetical protein
MRIRKIKYKLIRFIKGIKIVRFIITLVALVVSVSAIMGVVFLVYPTLALRALSLLPISWQNDIVINYLLTGGYGIIASVVVAILLWWVRSKIRF